MYNNYNNWHALSPKGSEMEVHKLRTQEMMHNTHNYYDPEVPDFDKNINGYYDQFEKKQEPFPWRRYFARGLDIAIYTTIFEAIAALIFKVNILETGFLYDVISTIFILGFMIFAESFFLSKFGTTPGKWIFGIKITNRDGELITFTDGLERTFGVIRYGLGFHIPIYSLYRLYKCYQNCRDNWGLEWDQDQKYQITLNDKKPFRIVLFIIVNIIIILLTIGIYQLSILPVHRGQITVEEFCENYNSYAKFYDLESDILLPDGTWLNRDETDIYTINVFDYEKPVFNFTEEDGILKGLSFEISKTNNNKNDADLYTNYEKEIFLATISYLHAQEKFNPFVNKSNPLLNEMLENLEKDCAWRAYDVDIEYDIDMTGYYSTGFGYWAEEDKDCSIRIAFKLQKVE